jgi:hypothetical protein
LKRDRLIRPGILAGLLVSFCAGVSSAADLRFIEVEQEEDVYSLRSVAWFDTDAPSLYNVLINYDLFPKFTSAIVEARNLEADESGLPGFYTRMEGCVLFWCQSLERTGYLRLEPMIEIVAVTDPTRSNFKLATERWQLRPEKNGTLLIYEFDMEPDFWVPPVVGPFYIKRALKDGGSRAVNRIEALALGKEPAPTD